MKKIAFYIDSMEMGGANRVIANLTEYFSNKKYEVILINDIEPRSEIKTYKVSNKVKRFFLDKNKKYSNNIIKQFERMLSLRKLVKKENIDVIVSFMGPPNYRMLLATIGLKIRKVVSVRNDPYREYGYGYRKVVAKTIFHLTDACVFQTNDAKQYFSKSVQSKSKVIFNPVNEKFYKVCWQPTEKSIAVVGRLQEQKNPLLALEAFASIADEFPEYKLVYYGDGDLKDEIIRKAAIRNLENRVMLYGKVSDIENYLAKSDIYVLSSNYEGMPNALMEAMAVGVPCIATDCPCGGPRSLIQDEKQGLLVPCRNANVLANTMRELLKNEKLRREMSLAERKRANEFAPDIIFKQWESFL